MPRPMGTILQRVRSRLVPALIFSAGMTLVAAGLLTYTNPVVALDPGASDGPVIIGESPEPESPVPSLLTLPPLISPSPSPSLAPSLPPVDRVATRVVIPALDIDLPVVKGPSGYPYCNVAMYIKELHQPGGPGATYIYAHAREGMFLPLLDQSKINNGKKMLGMLVEVYASDDTLFLYKVSQVRRHQPSLDAAFASTKEALWLQTSEGPKGTVEKLQVVATPFSFGAADHADAHPKAKPVICG